MSNRPLKVIIDTNLWISFLITKNYVQLDELIFSGNCILIFSKELLDEFLDVVQRPKFRKFFSRKDTIDLIEKIREYADFVNVTSNADACRDPKDNFLLSLAQDSRSDFLITGDKDLLEMENYQSTRIITMTDFLKKQL